MQRSSVVFSVGVVACGLASAIVGLLAPSLSRNALWLAVQACIADVELTGAPFPCVLVNLTGGKERGYAILRAPFGPPDTILTPTRRVLGVEDPWLESPDAPNYFNAAWRARSFLEGPDDRPPEADDFALAVNSALLRTQDQFHIHLGCLAPGIRRWLRILAPKLPIGTWTRADVAIAGSSFWALRTGQRDRAEVEPLRLAVRGLADKVQNPSRLVMLVTQVLADDSDEMLVLASYASPSGSLGRASAENLLDPSCSSESRPSGSNSRDSPNHRS